MKTLLSVAVLFAVATPSHSQDESRRYKTGQIRVGDHVTASPTSKGAGYPCVVTGIRDTSGWKPGFDGDFLLQCEQGGMTSAPATGDYVQFVAHGSAAEAARPLPRPYWEDPPKSAPTPAAAPARQPWTVDLPPVTPATPPKTQTTSPAPGGNRFGSRDPRPCPSITNQPSAAQAAQLAACSREGDSRLHLEWLVDNAVVTSMQPDKYDPYTQTGFTNLDVNVPILRIAGSMVVWQCNEQDGPGGLPQYSNIGKNCSRTTESRASGHCWKTRAGNWVCTMSDITTPYPQKDTKSGLPPPR